MRRHRWATPEPRPTTGEDHQAQVSPLCQDVGSKKKAPAKVVDRGFRTKGVIAG